MKYHFDLNAQRRIVAELDAMPLAILQSSLGFRLRTASPRQVDPAGDRAFIRLHAVHRTIMSNKPEL